MRTVDFGKTALVLAMAILAALLPAAADEPSPWLGVYLLDEVDGGIRIVAVVPGGPAYRAGIRSGDLLIEADNVPLADQQALERVLAGSAPDQALQVAVLRSGEQRTFRVQTTSRDRAKLFPAPSVAPDEPRPLPGTPPSPPRAHSAGLKTVPITEELRTHYGAPKDRGVLVVKIDEQGACGRAGIEVGDVIVAVGAEPVATPADVNLALARHDRGTPLKMELVRRREQQVRELAAEPPRAPVPPVDVESDEEIRVRYLERSIRALERQLETLRQQLAEIKRDQPEPANPDR